MESGARDLNECVVRGGDEYEFPMKGIRIYSFQLSIYDVNVSTVLVENRFLGSREDVHVYRYSRIEYI
jgi:hypothetical protein